MTTDLRKVNFLRHDHLLCYNHEKEKSSSTHWYVKCRAIFKQAISNSALNQSQHYAKTEHKFRRHFWLDKQLLAEIVEGAGFQFYRMVPTSSSNPIISGKEN